MKRFAGLVLAFWLLPFGAAFAQASIDGGASPPSASDTTAETAAARAARLAAIAAEKAEQGATAPTDAANTADGGETDSMPAGPAGGLPFTAETEAAYQAAWRAYYAYRADGYTHRQRVFEWQDVSTKIIFAVVILLVLAGIYFAGVQFHVGMREGREKGEPGEVEMSVKGIKVRSPVLGVIVLTISLAFFYLYLIYVYPIENVF